MEKVAEYNNGNEDLWIWEEERQDGDKDAEQNVREMEELLRMLS